MCLCCCWVACWRSVSAVGSLSPAPEGQQLCSSVKLGGLALFFFTLYSFTPLFDVCGGMQRCVHVSIGWVRECEACSCAGPRQCPFLPDHVLFGAGHHLFLALSSFSLGACCLTQWSWCGCWWMYGSVCARATLSDWKLLLTGLNKKMLKRAALLLWRKKKFVVKEAGSVRECMRHLVVIGTILRQLWSLAECKLKPCCEAFYSEMSTMCESIRCFKNGPNLLLLLILVCSVMHRIFWGINNTFDLVFVFVDFVQPLSRIWPFFVHILLPGAKCEEGKMKPSCSYIADAVPEWSLWIVSKLAKQLKDYKS